MSKKLGEHTTIDGVSGNRAAYYIIDARRLLWGSVLRVAVHMFWITIKSKLKNDIKEGEVLGIGDKGE